MSCGVDLEAEVVAVARIGDGLVGHRVHDVDARAEVVDDVVADARLEVEVALFDRAEDAAEQDRVDVVVGIEREAAD